MVQRRCGRQAGVALVMLLWFIAAMSLMVMGLMGEARLDIRLSQLYLRQAQAEALADGAIQRTLQALVEAERGEAPVPSVFTWEETRDGIELRAWVHSVSGFIDLNAAPESLLAVLFQHLGELDPPEALLLASKVVRWRGVKPEGSAPEPGFRYGRFEAPEDLLLVDGVSRQLYGRVAPALAVTSKWQEKIRLLSAPPEVLYMLAEGDESLVSHWQQAQLSPEPAAVQQPANLELLSSSSVQARIYRIEARVGFADGQVYRRVRWAEYGQQGLDRLPWHFFRTEPVARADQLDFTDN